MVFFAFDSAEITTTAKDVLQDDVEWLKERPNRYILVHGYADDTGPAAYNLELGRKRANAVRDYLVEQGVARDRIFVISHGEAGPDLPAEMERRAVYVSDAPGETESK